VYPSQRVCRIILAAAVELYIWLPRAQRTADHGRAARATDAPHTHAHGARGTHPVTHLVVPASDGLRNLGGRERAQTTTGRGRMKCWLEALPWIK
jgi:hypothetical protein